MHVTLFQYLEKKRKRRRLCFSDRDLENRAPFAQTRLKHTLPACFKKAEETNLLSVFTRRIQEYEKVVVFRREKKAEDGGRSHAGSKLSNLTEAFGI